MTTVLVVDDSQVDRTLVEQLLQTTNVQSRFAENGAVAAAEIRRAPPDIVITDMKMPEMDGLQLVQEIRRDNPAIPVIIMTSQGSEATAIEALQVGAASFVPKSRLSDRLLDTLHQVLSLKQVDHPYNQLLQCLNRSSNQFCLDSQLSLIPQLVDLVQRALASMQVCDATECIRLSLALEEGLLNALVHGSFELTSQVKESGFTSHPEYFRQRSRETPYCDRKIWVQIELSRRQIRFTVKDEGPGFDITSVLSPNDLRPFEYGVGRGLKLMLSFMHEVSYDADAKELTLIKNFD